MPIIPQYTLDQLNQLSCERVAEELGIEVIRHKALCFIHDDHHPSLVFRGKNRETWWCYVCNKGGSAINLVREYTGLGFVDACKLLGKMSGIQVDNSKDVVWEKRKIVKKKRVSADEVKPFSKEVVQCLLDNNILTDKGKYFLYDIRKLNPAIVEGLHIISIEDVRKVVEEMSKNFDKMTLVDSELFSVTNDRFYFRLFTPCLVIPYYDIDGNLVGLQSRYLGNYEEAPRFQFVSAQKTRMFNLPILKSLKFGDDLYISEGITDCLALLSSGKKAVAVPSATILPKDDLVKLKIYKLHMFPDNDESGFKAYKNLRRFFINHYVQIRAELLPECVKDYSELYMKEDETE